jgi:hypothetical protein
MLIAGNIGDTYADVPAHFGSSEEPMQTPKVTLLTNP